MAFPAGLPWTLTGFENAMYPFKHKPMAKPETPFFVSMLSKKKPTRKKRTRKHLAERQME